MSAISSEDHVGSLSKVARYDWKVSGRPAEFSYIDKLELKIDEAYQRSTSARRILEMARNWDWVSCGAISVAMRGDGEWFVMDGQHRVQAAMKRVDIKQLPCLIFELENIGQEAKGFLSINTGRKPMSFVDRFKALIIAKDPIALEVAKLIAISGRQLSKTPRSTTISCIQTLMRAEQANKATLHRLWPLIVELATGHTIDADLVNAFVWLEEALPIESLANSKWASRILNVGIDAIRDGIRHSVLYRSKRTPLSCGVGLLNAINKGLRNPLKIEAGDVVP